MNIKVTLENRITEYDRWLHLPRYSENAKPINAEEYYADIVTIIEDLQKVITTLKLREGNINGKN